MTKIILQVVFALFYLSAEAQKVSNVHAEQRGQNIMIFYSLETIAPCEISLLISQDNGATWVPLSENLSGDIGRNISSGSKEIVWRVLDGRDQLVGDRIKFKIKYKRIEIKKNYSSPWLMSLYMSRKRFDLNFPTAGNIGVGFHVPWSYGYKSRVGTSTDIYMGVGSNNTTFYTSFFNVWDDDFLYYGHPFEFTLAQDLEIALINRSSKLVYGIGGLLSIHSVNTLDHTDKLALFVPGLNLSIRFYSKSGVVFGAHQTLCPNVKLQNYLFESPNYQKTFELSPSNFSFDLGFSF